MIHARWGDDGAETGARAFSDKPSLVRSAFIRGELIFTVFGESFFPCLGMLQEHVERAVHRDYQPGRSVQKPEFPNSALKEFADGMNDAKKHVRPRPGIFFADPR